MRGQRPLLSAYLGSSCGSGRRSSDGGRRDWLGGGIFGRAVVRVGIVSPRLLSSLISGSKSCPFLVYCPWSRWESSSHMAPGARGVNVALPDMVHESRVGLRELGDGIERQMGKLARSGQDQESRFACGRMVLKGVGAETGGVQLNLNIRLAGAFLSNVASIYSRFHLTTSAGNFNEQHIVSTSSTSVSTQDIIFSFL